MKTIFSFGMFLILSEFSTSISLSSLQAVALNLNQTKLSGLLVQIFISTGILAT